ncbi:MAG: carbohydrate binding domain-containing protein, partial [Candidatus Acidiferrum sp.]
DAMNFFLSQHLADPALAVWNRQQSLGLPVQMADAVPLVDALIDANRTIEATQIWKQALRRSGASEAPPDEQSLVFNGGFEHDIVNGGYDWREETASGVTFNIDNLTAHSGSRSLRVQFDGTVNLDFHHLFQYIPVEPDSRYQFSAYLRTEAISTDRGICVAISDPRHSSKLQLQTSELFGSNPWTRVQEDFVTGHDTHFIKLALRRLPSWKFDNKLAGTVWIDDVGLTYLRPASRNGAT